MIKRKDETFVYKTIIMFLLLVIVAGLVYLIDQKTSFITSVLDNKNKITVTNTSTVTSNIEGIVITDVSNIVDEVMPSIVAITSKTIISSGNFGYSFYGNRSYTTTGAGSGVIVAVDDDEIFILTNYHVVKDTSELSVKFVDEKSYDANVKGVSERKDVAIVSVKKDDVDSDTLSSIKIATLGNSDELKVGNGIIAIGNALGYGQSVTTGVISALDREVSTDDYTQSMIQIDAAINGGNSGGALLNSKGEVIGINSAKYSSSSSSSSASIEGMGFAIPISDIKSLIEQLITGENDESTITLGIEGYMTTSSNMSSYNLPEGFYVTAITNGGYASKSNLEIGNIITYIDGNKVTSIESIRKVLNNKDKKDTVVLTVKYASKNEYKEKEITISFN